MCTMHWSFGSYWAQHKACCQKICISIDRTVFNALKNLYYHCTKNKGKFRFQILFDLLVDGGQTQTLRGD